MQMLFIDHISCWWGFAIGLLLMALELFVPTTVFLWTGISCVLVSVILVWNPGLPLIALLVAWAVLSVGSVWVAKIYHKDHPNAGERILSSIPPNQYGIDFVGMTTTLQSDSKEGVTRVNLKGASWGVKLPQGDMKAGAKVRITAVDGIYLVAEALDETTQLHS